MKKVSLFIGKGGVGKSTCSSLHSVRLSDSRNRTLLMSMDPAHNLHDIFQCPLSGKEKKITPNLFVSEIDLEKITRDYMKSIKKDLSGLYHYQQALNIEKYFKILKYAPGMEEYSAWLALESCYNKDKFERIIVDTPPTALTMKTLALSSVNLHWIRELEKMREEIINKKNTVKRIRKEDGEQELERDPVYRRLQKMKKRYENVLCHLQDRDSTEVILVLNEDELSFSESLGIRSGLGELAIPIGKIMINKSGQNPEWEKKIRNEFSHTSVEVVPFWDHPVTGMESLKTILYNNR